MTRDTFKDVARQAVEAVTVEAERRLSRPLPRSYILGWLGGPAFVPGDDIAELLTGQPSSPRTKSTPASISSSTTCFRMAVS